MTTLIAILIDGLIYASWLFIIAAGLSLIYGVMRVLNMAHGSFYAIGAYCCATVVGWYFNNTDLPGYGSFALMFIVTIFVGLFVGALIERFILRYLIDRDELIMVLVTFAILLILEDVTKLIWGVQSYYAADAYALFGSVDIGDLTFVTYDLSMILIASIVAILLWYFLNKTRLGKLLQAVIHDREIAVCMGINVKRVFFVTFAVGAALGALAGGLVAPSIAVTPGIGIEVIVIAFAVVVTGGLGSIQGAFIGSLLIGIARAASVNLYPELELFVIYGVMALVLVFRPTGLFVIAGNRKI